MPLKLPAGCVTESNSFLLIHVLKVAILADYFGERLSIRMYDVTRDTVYHNTPVFSIFN